MGRLASLRWPSSHTIIIKYTRNNDTINDDSLRVKNKKYVKFNKHLYAHKHNNIVACDGAQNPRRKDMVFAVPGAAIGPLPEVEVSRMTRATSPT